MAAHSPQPQQCPHQARLPRLQADLWGSQHQNQACHARRARLARALASLSLTQPPPWRPSTITHLRLLMFAPGVLRVMLRLDRLAHPSVDSLTSSRVLSRRRRRHSRRWSLRLMVARRSRSCSGRRRRTWSPRVARRRWSKRRRSGRVLSTLRWAWRAVGWASLQSGCLLDRLDLPGLGSCSLSLSLSSATWRLIQLQLQRLLRLQAPAPTPLIQPQTSRHLRGLPERGEPLQSATAKSQRGPADWHLGVHHHHNWHHRHHGWVRWLFLSVMQFMSHN